MSLTHLDLHLNGSIYPWSGPVRGPIRLTSGPVHFFYIFNYFLNNKMSLNQSILIYKYSLCSFIYLFFVEIYCFHVFIYLFCLNF